MYVIVTLKWRFGVTKMSLLCFFVLISWWPMMMMISLQPQNMSFCVILYNGWHISHNLNLSIDINDYPFNYIIHTKHDCPSQMNSNLMINVVSLLLLIIKFSFICAGQWYRLRITLPTMYSNPVDRFNICQDLMTLYIRSLETARFTFRIVRSLWNLIKRLGSKFQCDT